MPGNGIIYIAFGERYIKEALFSAASSKKFSDLSITLFTDKPVDHPAIDNVILIDPQHMRAKVDFIAQSPYDRTLYLDSDTWVRGALDDLFPILDRFDVAGVHDHSRKRVRWSKAIPDYDAIPYAFPEMNGGVMLFSNSPAAMECLLLWQKLFHQYRDQTGGYDQPTLRLAMWQSKAGIHSLPIEYNVRNKWNQIRMDRRRKEPGEELLLKPRILHWHGVGQTGFLRSLKSRYRPMDY